MDNFSKIIKEGVERFEVPYNDAHWAEMEGRLNSIRATKIRNTVLGSIAAVTLLAVSSYFMFSDNTIAKDNNNTIAETNTTEVTTNNETPSVKENLAIETNPITKETLITNEVPAEENDAVEVINNENEIIALDKKNEIKRNINKESSDKISINPEFIVYNNQVCLGEEVSFESLENDLPVSYTWNFGDGNISHKTNPKHKYKSSHVYTVTLTLLDRQTGKEYTSIQQDVVNILPTPNSEIIYSEESKKYDDNKLKYPYTLLSVKNASAKNTYKWKFENGDTYSTERAKVIFNKAGNYNVNLVTINSHGCEHKSARKITIENGSDIYVQDAFKPNSNIAENGTFIPKALIEWDVKFEMTILDRAGKEVYKTTDKSEPWNGKLNNVGQLLNEGIYMWQVVTYDIDNNAHQHHGKINLIK